MRRLATAFACVAIAAAAGGCGQTLDTASLEAQVTKLLHISAVHCPADVAPMTGETFVCTAQRNGKPVRVQVLQLDDKGNVEPTVLDGR